MRAAPRIELANIVAGVILEPQGGHKLEIAAPGQVVAMCFTRDQIPQLERAIAGFRETIAMDDGRGDRERTHRGFVPIDIG